MSYGHLQARFAKSCSDAAFGYARAATAAYVNIAGQSIDLWSESARSASRGFAPPEPEPPKVAATPFEFWMTASNDWMKVWGGMTPFADQSGRPSPMAVWWSLVPPNATPASWPMAYAFMSAGVPSAVAWPAAEANAAVIDATEAATETFTTTFSSYRSTTGFATAPYSLPTRMRTLLLCAAPFSAAMAFPWIFAAQQST